MIYVNVRTAADHSPTFHEETVSACRLKRRKNVRANSGTKATNFDQFFLSSQSKKFIVGTTPRTESMLLELSEEQYSLSVE
jgi:predicted DNA-binding helix-hairpin-helix protein